jgi:hypothetical protein
MRLRIPFLSTLVCSLALLEGQVQSKPASTVAATEGQNIFLRDMSIQRVTLYRYR